MDKKLKNVLKKNFSPPPSKNKDKFLKNIPFPRQSPAKTLFCQIGFIRKRVWFYFFIILLFSFAITNFNLLNHNIIAVISTLLPIFSLVATTEICKSTTYNMAEIELSCKYNLPIITLFRLNILGILGFLLLLAFILILNKTEFGIIRNFLYLSVPYLLCVNLNLFIITKFKNKDKITAAVTVCLIISIAIIVLSNIYVFIYSLKYLNVWKTAFIILSAFLIANLINFKKSQEEIQWSLS